MPFFATNTRFGVVVAPQPPEMRACAHSDLSSFFGRLAVHSGRASANQGGYQSALAIGQAVRAVEECYAGVGLLLTLGSTRQMSGHAIQLPNQHLRMLRSFVERSIRHARRVIFLAEHCGTGEEMTTHEELLAVFEHNVQMLRREVVRALRRQHLQLRWPTGETSRPNNRSLKGTKSGLTAFVNRVCYAVTRELGCFALPLLPLNPGSHALDRKADSFWNPAGLGLRWDDRFGWIVGSNEEVGSSEASTEVEGERMAEDEEDSEGRCGQASQDDCDYGEQMEEDMGEDPLIGGKSTNGLSTDEELGSQASKWYSLR